MHVLIVLLCLLCTCLLPLFCLSTQAAACVAAACVDLLLLLACMYAVKYGK